MRAVNRLSVALLVTLLSPVTREASAQSPWMEVKSPHFTVLSNDGERRARDVAWQFEQFRSAIELGWPWARVQLDRPVVIIAAKDESSMRTLLPGYWEQRGGARPVSVFVTGPDVSYIVLRTDVRGESTATTNPYQTSVLVLLRDDAERRVRLAVAVVVPHRHGRSPQQHHRSRQRDPVRAAARRASARPAGTTADAARPAGRRRRVAVLPRRGHPLTL